MMKDYHIGTLEASSLKALKDTPAEDLSSTRETFLVPNQWAGAILSRKRILSPDTRLLSFALNHDSQTPGLPVGQHVMLKIKTPSDSTNMSSIIRAYTPLSETSIRGRVDVLIKVYNPTPNFPTGGKMTMALDRLPTGTAVEFKGPIGKFQYLGEGNVLVNSKERHVDRFYMICGGSGVTPIFQVLRAVLKDENDNTACTVLDGNRSEVDILCRSELDSFATLHKGKCKVVHALSQPSETWSGHRGRISEYLLKQHVVYQGKSMVLICGPQPMESSVRRMLLGHGWAESDLLFF